MIYIVIALVVNLSNFSREIEIIPKQKIMSKQNRNKVKHIYDDDKIDCFIHISFFCFFFFNFIIFFNSSRMNEFVECVRHYV